jgi:hypothetical protein
MAGVRHFVIDEPAALYRPGAGAVLFYANASMQHQLVHLTAPGRFLVALFRTWQLRGRPYMAVVLRNVPPGHYTAAWPFGRLELELLVLPGRVTRVDWRAIDYHARAYDQMVPPAAPDTIAPLPAAPPLSAPLSA